MSCVDLARGFVYLANRGTCQHSGERVISQDRAKRINALMLTCGTYDAAGDFAFHVGLPVKSGVGGGMVAVRSEEHTSELQSLMRISYAVFCLKKKTTLNKE